MSFTVLATPRSFAKNDDAPIRLLEEQGCTVIRLPMNGGDLQAQLLEQLPQADAVIAGLEPYTRSMLETAKNLKIISRYGRPGGRSCHGDQGLYHSRGQQ